MIQLSNAYTKNERRSLETIYESAQDQIQLSLHSFDFGKMHLSLCACTPPTLAIRKVPTCGRIVQPSIRTETLLKRSMPTEIDNTINVTHLHKRISLQMKHSYHYQHLHKRRALTQRPNPRVKHIYDKKPSLDRNKLSRLYIVGGEVYILARLTQFHRPTMIITMSSITTKITKKTMTS